MLVTPFQIQIQNLSKSFLKQFIFKDLFFSLFPGDRLAITGPNGAGKSTFLKVFVGKIKPDTGSITFIKGKKHIPSDYLYKNVAWYAPYLEIYPYFNIQQTFYWHFRFFQPLLNYQEWLEILDLKAFQNKPLKNLSSGTLQRAKVGLAIFSDTPILVLDEPTANMDSHNAHKIIDLIYTFSKDRILVIASNLIREIHWIKEKKFKLIHSENLNFYNFITSLHSQ